jgi:hypothetical protein
MITLPVLLPDGFTPIVAVGDTVTIHQVLATKKASSSTAVINIAKELSLPITKAGKAVKKPPGETISPGDIIASRSGFLGLGEQKVVSSVNGVISGYERRTGEMTIHLDGATSAGEDESFLSPLAGAILVCDNGTIVIETDKDALTAEYGSGGSAQSELYMITHKSDSPIPLHLLSPEIIGKIIIGSYLDRDGLLKAIGVGTTGIIVHKIADADSLYLREKHADMPFVQMSQQDFETMVKWSGKQVFLDGEKKNVVLLHV